MPARLPARPPAHPPACLQKHDEPGGPASAIAGVRYASTLLGCGEAAEAQLVLAKSLASLEAAVDFMRRLEPESEEERHVRWGAAGWGGMGGVRARQLGCRAGSAPGCKAGAAWPGLVCPVRGWGRAPSPGRLVGWLFMAMDSGPGPPPPQPAATPASDWPPTQPAGPLLWLAQEAEEATEKFETGLGEALVYRTLARLALAKGAPQAVQQQEEELQQVGEAAGSFLHEWRLLVVAPHHEVASHTR